MARKIYSRLKISGKLSAETPLHVGGLGGNTDTDMALAVNGKGEFYVPGTSLTGVLRAWCEKNFGEEEIKKLFGFQKDDSGQASFVLIEDASIENAADILTEIRDGVGIDRFYGTAADGAKYDREILPKGSTLNFEMTIEIGDRKLKSKEKWKSEQDKYDETEEEFEKRIIQTKAIFGHLLEALRNCEIRFGGSRTRGLGKLKLSLTEKITDESFIGFDNIIEILNRKIAEKNNQTESDVDTEAEIKKLIEADGETKPDLISRLDITIDWSPVQPLMVKAGFEGIGVDMLPLVSQKDGKNVALVLPGSSIKGALRSHAERIMRTLLGETAKGKKDFHAQIQISLVDEIFGAKKDSPKGKDSEEVKNRKKTLGIGALAIDDCFAEKTFPAKDWSDVTSGRTKENNEEVSYEKQELWKSLRKIDGADIAVAEEVKKDTETFKINHHNAIDRFTGGAADSALYSVLAPTKISWDKMQFSLDFSRIKNKDEKIEEAGRRKCLMLLLLVLRDLAENRLPLGFATTRGMGELKINNFELIGKNLEKIGLDGDVSIKMENGKFMASNSLKKLGGEKWWETNQKM
ncbi:hypothetical protein BH20ACI4_BH20ACI4_15460 [soil metagenome]